MSCMLLKRHGYSQALSGRTSCLASLISQTDTMPLLRPVHWIRWVVCARLVLVGTKEHRVNSWCILLFFLLPFHLPLLSSGHSSACGW